MEPVTSSVFLNSGARCMLPTMRVTLVFLLGLFSLSSVAWAQDVRPLDVSKVARAGQSPKDFIPSGWKLDEAIRGDLNKDGQEDAVVVLSESGPETNAEGELNDHARALVVLFAEGDTLRFAGAANKVLYCSTCTGTMGGGPGGRVRIQKGVIIVEQISGARETLGTTLRFRHDPKDGRFVLIGEDLEMRDRLTGESEKVSTNLLTGLKLTETLRYDEKRDKDVTVSSKKEKVAVKRAVLEDVDISSY